MVQNKHNFYIYSICLALAGFAAACSDDSKNVENTLTCADGLTICGHACCANTCCDGICVDTKNDKNNCGSCGNACLDDKVCKNNGCVANEEACKDGQEWCNGECVSIQTDAKHCGDCETRCDSGESCHAGKCVAGCAENYTYVGDGKCVDTQRDSENCGGAGIICGDNAYCADGSCSCRNGYFNCDDDMTNGCESNVVCDYACESGQQVCQDTGACCDANTVCCGSSCCSEGTTCCGADLCLDLNSDSHHCGNCDTVCGTNQVCESGQCVDSEVTCPAEEGVIACWGNCVQSLQDKDNCGGCGHACEEGQACTEGKCTVACADDESVCGDYCAKLTEDPLNCGECGHACTTTQVCDTTEEGTACKEMTEVNPEFVCENTTDPETGAENAMTQCWSECVGLQTDVFHCGACGHACDEGFDCVAGACAKICDSGLNACGDNCYNFQSDYQACGNCETQCTTTQTCVDGVCTDSTVDCNEGADPEDPAFVEKTLCWGACTDLKTDVANCGSCGKQCEENQICTNGVCTDNGPVIVDCDEASKCYGVCKDFMNDDANCGKCLNVCGTGEKCIQGKCELQCGSLTNCGKACIDTTSSKNNCGGCGVVCKDGQSCVGGACQCAEGRYDCDGDAANGCEATEKCTCKPGATQGCWRGAAENRGKGICKDGSQTCDASGQFWGPCTGGTYPSEITCDDKGFYIGGDQNCNGVEDSSETCVTKCEIMAGSRSYIGCEYWPVYLNNSTNYNQYYIIMSNPSTTQSAKVYIFTKATYNSKKPIELTVGPGKVERYKLNSTGPTASGIFDTAYRVVSSIPIVMYQFNPMPDNAQTYTNDASLLLPRNTLGSDYYILNWTGGTPDNASMTVVAVEPGNTQVTIIPKTATTGSGGFAAIGAGTSKTVTLKQFDVLNLENSSAELTGSSIKSDKPVAVYAGSLCSYVPAGKSFCDHLEEQIFPTQIWGKAYYAVKTRPRSKETEIWRIVAKDNNTSVQLSSPINKTISLNAGQYYELETKDSFEVTANNPILVGQFMVGSQYNAGGTGDPSFLLDVPYEQYRSNYDFLVPPTYHSNYITLIVPASTTVKLDGNAVDLSSFASFGSSGFKYGYIDLGTEARSHHIEATNPIGVWGYGFATNVSYCYPVGLDLKVINTN